MSQPQTAKSQRLFQNSVDEEDLRRRLQEEKRSLAAERREFEREKREFRIEQKIEKERISQESRLFEMKWKILEAELQKLAVEKQEIDKERKKNRSIRAEYQSHTTAVSRMFFSGVNSESGMKKRYKDLIKIFHPDNMDGDTQTLQVINREYDELKKLFCR